MRVMPNPYCRRWAILLACALFMGTAFQAEAQRRTNHGKAIKADPIVHIKKANKHFKKRQYTDALVEYSLAHSLNPTPAGLFNIGQTLEAMGHTDAAIRMYQYYLQFVKTAATHQYEAQQRIDRLQRGPVAVTPPPPSVQPPARPNRAVPTPPPATPKVVSNQGKLALVVMPPGATIRIDGESIGKAPLRSPINLLVGNHTVTVSMPGYTTTRKTVRVTQEAVTPLTVMLSAASGPPAQQEVGTLQVRSIPAGSTVMISGRKAPYRGDTLRVRVAPGSHTVEVKNARYQRFFRRVGVSPGETVTVQVQASRR